MEKYSTLMGISEISRYAGIPRMSFYSRRSEGKRGRKPSSFTVRNADGIEELVSNTSVVNVIEDLLSREFVCYGYKKTTKHLQNSGYRINRKKAIPVPVDVAVFPLTVTDHELPGPSQFNVADLVDALHGVNGK